MANLIIETSADKREIVTEDRTDSIHETFCQSLQTLFEEGSTNNSQLNFLNFLLLKWWALLDEKETVLIKSFRKHFCFFCPNHSREQLKSMMFVQKITFFVMNIRHYRMVYVCVSASSSIWSVYLVWEYRSTESWWKVKCCRDMKAETIHPILLSRKHHLTTMLMWNIHSEREVLNSSVYWFTYWYQIERVEFTLDLNAKFRFFHMHISAMIQIFKKGCSLFNECDWTFSRDYVYCCN